MAAPDEVTIKTNIVPDKKGADDAVRCHHKPDYPTNWGPQTVYERKSGTGKSKAFAYTDSGVLNGWQLN